ncbi:MAG TPA: hypothetical protein VNS61_04905 [Caldimonas sp.]|nr:hypothetical protein [Caldimonas sp.]
MATSTLRRWIGTTSGRLAIGLAAFAIAAGVTWFALNDSVETVRVAMPLSSSPPVAIDAPASSAAPASTPEVAVVDEASHADDEVQMCGGEWVKTGADGEVIKEEAEAFERRALEATKRPALEAMEASGDERVQAAAHFFQSNVEGHREALVRFAQATTDPQVYAWAVQACRRADALAQGSCQLVSAEQWARLDPTNAIPWLTLAREAEQHHEATALDDAMFHVASAERVDAGWGQLPSAVIEHVPSGEAHLVGALALAIEAIGIDAAGTVDYQAAFKYCNAAGLADANRRETCERVAELFVHRSTTLLEDGLGTGLGKRLGWPSERLESLRREHEALFEAVVHETMRIDGTQGCADLRRELERIRNVARYGEIGTARLALEASGKTFEQVAVDYRQDVAKILGKAQQAEAAASAASAADR